MNSAWVGLYNKSVFFIRHGWRKWTKSCHKILFQSRSVCDRNTSIGAKGLCEQAVNRSIVFRWYSRFCAGRKQVESEERSGRPKSTRTEVNTPAVANLVTNDRRITSRKIAEPLNIPKTKCFVPYSLTPEQREGRDSPCQVIIAMADADNFLNKLISGDQTWCFAYDPETKRQSSEPAGETSSPPKNCNSKRPASRSYWYFFDSQGTVHKEFVPEGKTVNAVFYKEVMDRLLKRIQWVRSAAFFSRDFFLLLNNVPPAHKAAIFDPQKCYKPLSPPYSPDFITTRLFSVLQVEREFKRSPICGCCWDPRRRKWWIKYGPKREIFGSF